MAGNTFRLVTLGRVALLSPDGEPEPSLGTRRRKLALLAYLAGARRPVQRDELVEMFWGAQQEERARHSLTDALSHLRRVLGPEALSTRQTQIALAPDIPLMTDVAELVSAAARRDYAGVVDLYQGEFLAGVEVEDSPTFERWLLRERERLRTFFVEACELHCGALAAAGAWPAAAVAARRWLEADATSADAAVALLTALRALGTRGGHRQALSEYRQLAARLSREYDWEPSDRVSSLAAIIAGEEEAMGEPLTAGEPPQPAHVGGGSAGEAVPPEVAARVAVPAAPAARRRFRRPALAAAAVIALAVLFLAVSRLRAPAAPAVRALAVLDIRDLSRTPGDEWLEEGLPQMIGAQLFSTRGMEVIPPERVREVRRRGELSGAALTLAQALDLGRRLGASVVVRGGFSHGGSVYVLDLTLHDAATGRILSMQRVSGRDLLSTADAAAARVAAFMGSEGAGPAYTELQTSSLEAYEHYMRAVQARDEGRSDEITGEVDEALRLDPSFVAALRLRLDVARVDGDRTTERKVADAIAQAARRASPFDRLAAAIGDALDHGERDRTEALARELLRRYPRDPRAYRSEADVLFAHGDFAGEEAVLERALALDSLGMEAGQGPCVPCVAYAGLADVRILRGDGAGATAAAARWVRLQPEIPAAWNNLASVQSMTGDFAGAVRAQQRAILLDPTQPERMMLARIWLMAGQLSSVDSLIAAWERTPSPELRASIADLRATLERERGQYRAALATLRTAGDLGGLDLVEANTLARLGDRTAADRIYERSGHPTDGTEAERARAYCWAHALEAEDVAAAGAPARLQALADSVDAMSRRSYYARDWHLADHIHGLLALRERRYADAAREFAAARFGVAGWTATGLHLAEAQLATGDARAAIRTLHQAQMGPLDGMGRYVTRTELAYALARAFQAAGERDSARVYAAAVRRGWSQADPEVRARLSDLPN